MKQFKDYLIESQKTYIYRIKIVGDVSSDQLNAIKDKLVQFDPVKVSAMKTSPVQSKIADFPAFSNDRVHSVDVEFKYPAIEPQIKQIAQLAGIDPNRVLMLTSSYQDSIDKENQDIEAQNKDLLTDTDFPAPDKIQKSMSNDYGASPYDHAVLKNAYRSSFTVAGGKTPKASTTNDVPQGTKSPMSTIKRPPKPATGSNPRG